MAWLTYQDFNWLLQTLIFPFNWSYEVITCMWYKIYGFLVTNLQAALTYLWNDIIWILYITWFIVKLAILAIFTVIIIYLAVLFYRFLSCRDFTLQCKYYFGPTPPQHNQGQGVLTIAPVILDPQGQGRARLRPPPLAQQAQQ